MIVIIFPKELTHFFLVTGDPVFHVPIGSRITNPNG